MGKSEKILFEGGSHSFFVLKSSVSLFLDSMSIDNPYRLHIIGGWKSSRVFWLNVYFGRSRTNDREKVDLTIFDSVVENGKK